MPLIGRGITQHVMFLFKVVQLLAEMSEQVGPSCFKNTSHILQFAQVKDQLNQIKCDVKAHSP